jgi:hypothetical protein
MLRMMKRKRRSSVRSGGAGSGASGAAGATVAAARGAKQLAHRKKEELLAQWRRFSNQRNKYTQTDDILVERETCVARTQTDLGFVDDQRELDNRDRRLANHMPYTLHQSHIQNWENAGWHIGMDTFKQLQIIFPTMCLP